MEIEYVKIVLDNSENSLTTCGSNESSYCNEST
jgi:hypothetical protein